MGVNSLTLQTMRAGSTSTRRISISTMKRLEPYLLTLEVVYASEGQTVAA
jgi:hypothetical protein